MKHILPYLLTFVVLLISPVYATSQQAYQDYLYQFDLYRTTFSDFQVSKNEYEKFGSLTSETTALEKTKLMLTQRDQLLRAYLLLLNEKLSESSGLSSNERGLYQSLLINEVKFLESHSALIPSIGSLEDAVDVSKQLESHYNILQATMRQTISAISLGGLSELASQYDTVVIDAKNLISQNRTFFSPQKQAVLDRWVLQIANKRSLYQQKTDTVKSLSSTLKGDIPKLDDQFTSIQKNLSEARQYLAEGSSFITELFTAIRYQE